MFDMHDHTLILWVSIIIIVLVVNFFSYRMQASRHRMIETLAEKGQPIPPEMFSSRSRSQYRYHSPIQSGIFLMCIGVALGVFFWAQSDIHGVPNWLPFVGIFPFMVGLARLLGGIFDRPRDR